MYLYFVSIFVFFTNLYLYFVSIEANCDKVITPQQEDLAVVSSARRTSAVVRRSLSSVSQAAKPKYDCNCLLFKHKLLPFSSLLSIKRNTNDRELHCHLQDFSAIPPLLSSYWRPIFHAEVNILRLFPFKGSFAHILHRRIFVRFFSIVLEKVEPGRNVTIRDMKSLFDLQSVTNSTKVPYPHGGDSI